MYESDRSRGWVSVMKSVVNGKNLRGCRALNLLMRFGDMLVGRCHGATAVLPPLNRASLSWGRKEIDLTRSRVAYTIIRVSDGKTRKVCRRRTSMSLKFESLKGAQFLLIIEIQTLIPLQQKLEKINTHVYLESKGVCVQYGRYRSVSSNETREYPSGWTCAQKSFSDNA